MRQPILLRSMTGYGSAVHENRRYRITVRIRSVNHRGLDLVLRIADEHRERENGIRRLVSDRLHRGRVDLRVDIESGAEAGARVELRLGLIRELRKALDQLRSEGFQVKELTASDLLRIPEAIEIEVRDDEWEQPDQDLLDAAVEEALDRLVAEREQEGLRLADALSEQLDDLEREVDEISVRQPELRRQLEARLRERVGALVEPPVAEERLAQELVLLADRSDVREEIDRLGSHLAGFRQVLGEGGRVGKRLEFFSQEILRELNTLGAKCRDEQTVRSVIEAKVICERLREQLQNIE